MRDPIVCFFSRPDQRKPAKRADTRCTLPLLIPIMGKTVLCKHFRVIRRRCVMTTHGYLGDHWASTAQYELKIHRAFFEFYREFTVIRENARNNWIGPMFFFPRFVRAVLLKIATFEFYSHIYRVALTAMRRKPFLFAMIIHANDARVSGP